MRSRRNLALTPKCHYVRTMTKSKRHEMILAQIEATTKRGLKSKHAARTILISEGIYTAKGNLKKEFGGRGARRSTAKHAA